MVGKKESLGNPENQENQEGLLEDLENLLKDLIVKYVHLLFKLLYNK
jgi:hypothetical protein